ncbi:MAG: nuclear transport factor 2 family protein [Ilumatobacteraceae bacterium]
MSTPVEVSDLVHRYCDAVVRKDRDQWAATWAPDAHWDLGRGRVMDGVDAIVEYWVQAMDAFATVVQLAHNGQVTVDGERATGRWYISEHIQRADGTKGLLLAYYDDTYTVVEGHWRFASRAITILYRGPADLSAEFANVSQS